MKFAQPPSTRERLRRAPKPPKRKPGTPKVHLDNLMRGYLKRLVAVAMPDYQTMVAQHARRSALLEEVLKECAAGDEGDITLVLPKIRAELYPETA